ncbi:MAG: hypothetical protein C4526_09755 [Nitrospiraceae bacterium]|nr:MAG: hypothetical protein C4526_09755 [Nitrospiraceae bacterium]
MRKMIRILIATALVMGLASVAMARIEGTPHDVNVMKAGTGLEICAMCHTPHSGTGDYPLWNRQQAATSYGLYDSPTYDATAATNLQAPSTLCMICHNGVASQLVNYPGVYSVPDTSYDLDLNNFVSPWTNLGTGMTDDHPVSFTYNPSSDYDGNDFPPIATDAGSGRKYANGAQADYPLYGSGNDQFECATCHSVHDTENYTGKGQTQVYFLRTDNSGSAMCTDCHRAR